jgi:dUTP pyrophosphatase
MYETARVKGILARDDILARLRQTPPLVECMVDADRQVQVNGVDLTLLSVERFDGPGSVSWDNAERQLAKTEELGFTSDGWLVLEPGCFKVRFNERVNLPLDLAAIARSRSTLIRCGAFVATAFWDAGYSGRSESLLVVVNPHGCRLQRNARIVQLAFVSLSRPVAHGYQGRYQEEHL